MAVAEKKSEICKLRHTYECIYMLSGQAYSAFISVFKA